MKITHIVAHDRDRCIGKDNDLAWHIPEDLQHFKQLTTGGVIVMGRKTFESLPRLLPNRSHHIITRSPSFERDGTTIAHDIHTAIANATKDAQARGQDEIFIIGGGEIYAQSLALADCLEITEVDLSVDGDAFYPPIGDDFEQVACGDWQTDAASGVRFRFTRWIKKAL